jgi:EAL domain-containing protein (putative c-di-GMP-specific phosphodiesterase class I)
VGRVLLADDEPIIRRVYGEVLGKAGHDVTTAPNGETALEALRTDTFDVVLSDISMPRMSGLELLRAVRERDLDVPVLLMTAGSALKTAAQAVEYGASRFLFKPVEETLMLEAVQRAIALHDLARLKRQALELLGQELKLGDRASLETRFRIAVETLWMAFQPIVAWSERRVFGYEAFLRTDEPTLARPEALIDAAERLGRMNDLGRTIRAYVAARVAEAPPEAKLFINLHTLDFADEQLFAASSPLSASARRVVLEVTERAPLDRLKDPRLRTSELRRLGFTIAIDDLGAGYAGLSSFALLEPEMVKLDLSLVRHIHAHPVKRKLVQEMVKRCGDLGMLVVAEGIESPQERDTLAEVGCNLFQGHLFAHPGRGFPEPKLS